MSDTDKFKSILAKRGGLASPNKFILVVPFINFSLSLNQLVFEKKLLPDVDFRDISYMCESVNFPGMQIASIDDASSLRPVKKPNGYINNDLSVTFLLTNDYYMKRIFDAWKNLIINNEHQVGYKDVYVRDLFLIKLDRKGVPTYQIRLENAWPVTIGDINNDAGATASSYQRMSVQFAYDDFTTSVIDLKGLLNGGIKDFLLNPGQSLNAIGDALNNGVSKIKNLF